MSKDVVVLLSVTRIDWADRGSIASLSALYLHENS